MKKLEAISKPQIVFEGKAWADDKAQHTGEYVSILKRPSTQPSSTRWDFEMASRGMLEFRGYRLKAENVFTSNLKPALWNALIFSIPLGRSGPPTSCVSSAISYKP